MFYDSYYMGHIVDPKKIQEIYYDIGVKVGDFFEEIGPQIFNLELRDGQYEMACNIIDALRKNRHLLVEAGVGVGKTFAYLLPLIFVNREFKRPIFIATTTIALQEQLKSDIETLAKYVYVHPNVILIKGQSHYICLKRSYNYFDKHNLSKDEIALKKLIDNGKQDESEFGFQIPFNIWDRINIKKYNNRGNCYSCKYRNDCLYHQTRIKLIYFRGFVLCNQDLLNVHLQSIESGSNGILNAGKSIVVVDEAHNLETKVRNSTTIVIEKKTVLDTIYSARKSIDKTNSTFIQSSLKRADNSVRHFFDVLNESIERQIQNSKFNIQDIERFEFQSNDKEFKSLSSLKTNINDYAMEIEIANSIDYSWLDNETEAIKDLKKYGNQLQELVDNIDNWIIWIEKSCSNKHDIIKFCFCPKNTKDIIKKLFFSGDNLYIFTSATLRNNASGSLENQYQYFIKNTGFPVNENGIIEEAKESPFPYEKNAMIYYCNDMPHPTSEHEKFIVEGTERLVQLLKISKGKALVLFTAKSDMNEVYEILKTKNLPYKILIQSTGSSQNQVKDEFKKNINSVLLGTGSYWEGISLEGETLSNLIIFRLPFPIPDPIINCKTSSSNNPLMDVLVPEMIIKLKQGMGRLIRNFTDKGIVTIIDGRLQDVKPKPYRDIVWNSLPIKNKTTDIEKLKEFYLGLYEN